MRSVAAKHYRGEGMDYYGPSCGAICLKSPAVPLHRQLICDKPAAMRLCNDRAKLQPCRTMRLSLDVQQDLASLPTPAADKGAPSGGKASSNTPFARGHNKAASINIHTSNSSVAMAITTTVQLVLGVVPSASGDGLIQRGSSASIAQAGIANMNNIGIATNQTGDFRRHR